MRCYEIPARRKNFQWFHRHRVHGVMEKFFRQLCRLNKHQKMEHLPNKAFSKTKFAQKSLKFTTSAALSGLKPSARSLRRLWRCFKNLIDPIAYHFEWFLFPRFLNGPSLRNIAGKRKVKSSCGSSFVFSSVRFSWTVRDGLRSSSFLWPLKKFADELSSVIKHLLSKPDNFSSSWSYLR